MQTYEEIIQQMHNLSNGALRCLLFIARQTLGWTDKRTGLSKEFDWLAMSQLVGGIRGSKKEPYFKGVGLSRRSIDKALSELVENGYIQKRAVCPHCETDVPQVKKTVIIKGKEVTRGQVHARCPHCQEILLGHERIYYGLRYWVQKVPSGRAKSTLGGGQKLPSQVVKEPIIKETTSSKSQKQLEPKQIKDIIGPVLKELKKGNRR